MSVSFESLNLKSCSKVKIFYSDGTYSLKRLVLCDNFVKRFIGMLFTRKERNKDAFLIIPCDGVHTFFMAYPIDVVFLSKDCHVSSCATLVPWRIKSDKNAYAVLEGTRLLKSDNYIVQVEFLC